GHVEGPAAAGVARLLGQLLEAAPYPAELRVLVETYATDRRSGAAAVDAVADFVSELAFFERPGRREVLSTIAQRAEPALEPAPRAEMVEEDLPISGPGPGAAPGASPTIPGAARPRPSGLAARERSSAGSAASLSADVATAPAAPPTPATSRRTVDVVVAERDG